MSETTVNFGQIVLVFVISLYETTCSVLLVSVDSLCCESRVETWKKDNIESLG